MMISHFLAFGCGCLAMLILGYAYLLHVERMNRHLIDAVRQNERRRAYAQGYQDRALIALRAGRPGGGESENS